MSYAIRGRGHVTAGPIVVAVDLSGSTQGAVEVWEKAIAVALVLEAGRTGRAARLIGFSRHVPLAVYDFPATLDAAARLQTLMDFGTLWMGGGTIGTPPSPPVSRRSPTPRGAVPTSCCSPTGKPHYPRHR